MRNSIPLLVLAAAAVVSAPLSAFARDGVDSMPGVDDGPALSASAARMTALGFAGGAYTSAGKGDSHTMTYVEEGADGKPVTITIDTMTGRVVPPKKSK